MKSRQEEAWEYISNTFIRLINTDKNIAYDHKRSVIAFWEDLFWHDGVKNNILQAVSNLLWEIDGKMDSARKAGIMMALSTIERNFPKDAEASGVAMTKQQITLLLESLLKSEGNPEEQELGEDEIQDMDLSEVGGNDEDDTPLV